MNKTPSTNCAASVLIVDDDPAVGKVLGAILRQDGLEATHVLSGAEALKVLELRPVDLVITDLRMPGIDGMQLLDEVIARSSDVPVVLLTAHGSVTSAVEAIKRGAADFLLKPFDRDDILYVIRKALQGSEKNRAKAPEALELSRPMIGQSQVMHEVYATIRRAAPSLATVLIRGESGTGKELVARAIHEASPRRSGAFVKVHCAALPDNLLESELFGYEKGAFTGATNRKPGRVELATGGTLFLDEIGDITPALQVKLLRVLQDREYERLGGTQTLSADVRFLAATHRNLEAMVEAGQFRQDLFYRLNVVPIWLPPLRERPGDAVRLTVHFCRETGLANGKSDARLTQGAIDLLAEQPWPGNVRQLQNFVERLVVLSDGPELGAADVLRELGRQPVSTNEPPAPVLPPREPDEPPPSSLRTLEDRVSEAEREALLRALARSGNNRTLAARILGVSRRTLYNKLERLGLL